MGPCAGSGAEAGAGSGLGLGLGLDLDLDKSLGACVPALFEQNRKARSHLPLLRSLPPQSSSWLHSVLHVPYTPSEMPPQEQPWERQVRARDQGTKLIAPRFFSTACSFGVLANDCYRVSSLSSHPLSFSPLPRFGQFGLDCETPIALPKSYRKRFPRIS